jgi:hypothetical protein
MPIIWRAGIIFNAAIRLYYVMLYDRSSTLSSVSIGTSQKTLSRNTLDAQLFPRLHDILTGNQDVTHSHTRTKGNIHRKIQWDYFRGFITGINAE